MTALIWHCQINRPAHAQEEVDGSAAMDSIPVDESELQRESDRISKLLKQLADRKYSIRHQAMIALYRVGPVAREQLFRAIETGDLDLRHRGFAVVDYWGRALPITDLRELEKSMTSLVTHQDQRLSRLAFQTWTELRAQMEIRVRAHMLRKGAKMSITQLVLQNSVRRVQTLTIDTDWQGSAQDAAELDLLVDVEHVIVDGIDVDESLAGSLTRMQKLMALSLKGAQVESTLLRDIIESCHLSMLELFYIDVGEPVIGALTDSKTLKSLRLFGGNVSQDERNQLRTALPNCEVDVRKGGFLGIQYLASGERLKITNVVGGTGAEAGGLLVDDVIVNFGEVVINRPSDLVAEIAKYEPEEDIPVVIERNGKKIALTIHLTKWR